MIVKIVQAVAENRGVLQYIRFTPRIGVVVGSLLIVGAIALFGLAFIAAPVANAGSTCQPNQDYALPSPVVLTSTSNGLTVRDEGISTYGVGGNSIEAVREALNTCTPRFMGTNTSGEFLAYTSYSLSWDYEIISTGSVCHLEDVKVGLRLSQLFPRLINKSTAPSDVTAKWMAFNKGLTEHEDGHKALDVTQASTLLRNLELVSESCDTIQTTVNTIANNATQEIIRVNAEHDTQTNSGVTEGAVW